MKSCFLFAYCILLLSHAGFSQVTIKFIDQEKKEPIESIFLLDQKGELISISNTKGESIVPSKIPLKLNHLSYAPLVFSAYQDTTIYLKNNFREINEVIIKGMTNEQLLEEIIKKSQAKVKQDGVKLEGKYFEMLYYIEEKSHDTVQTIFIADLEVLLPKKKKSKYQYYLSNEQKQMTDLSTLTHAYDTVQYNTSIKISGPLHHELESYDLRSEFKVNKKKYKASKRYMDKVSLLEFYGEKRDFENTFKVYYDPSDSSLMSNVMAYTSNKAKDEKPLIDFAYYSSTKNYGNTPFYFMNFLAMERETVLNVNGRTDRIIGVKAFIINSVSEIEENYSSSKKEIKDLTNYSSKFPANAHHLPILINQTRF